MDMAKHHYGCESVTSHGDFEFHSDAEKAFISGHFGFSYAQSRLTNRFSFTFLRDPVDRLISLYNFYRCRDPKEFSIYALAHAHDFANFVEVCSKKPSETGCSEAKGAYETVWNHMTWQLAYGWDAIGADPCRKTIFDFSGSELLNLAKSNLKSLDFIGLDRTFETDAKLIASRLGMPHTQIPLINASERTIRREDMAEETIRLVECVNSLDTELYTYARSLRS